MNWNQAELFQGVDLNDSFILSWIYDGSRLSFILEASFWPESEYYVNPKLDEFTCYREATLEFIGFSQVSCLVPIESAPSTIDLDGTKDYGNVDSLEILDGAFELSGDFGVVSILGGELTFKIHA